MSDIDVIPSVYDMDDETFKKHANKRHVGRDFLMVFSSRDQSRTVIEAARAAHDYWHRVGKAEYDHWHLDRGGDEDDE